MGASQYAYERLKPEYGRLWAAMKVTKVSSADLEAHKIIANKMRYMVVENETQVPWFVIGCMHQRESDGDFRTWLHNGDPMRRGGTAVRTVHVPAGRPPNPNVSWEAGADDALHYEHLDHLSGWCPELVAYACEKFNGWGYRAPGRAIPSPYLWGGTSVQKVGKFVRDGVYSSTTWDPQIGAMAVLKRVMDLDTDATWPSAPKLAPAPPTVVAKDDPIEQSSPKAVDTEDTIKPLMESRTMWGGGLTVATGALSSVGGFLSNLDSPYALAGFGALLLVVLIGGYLVISGRLNVQAMVKHLADDPKAV